MHKNTSALRKQQVARQTFFFLQRRPILMNDFSTKKEEDSNNYETLTRQPKHLYNPHICTRINILMLSSFIFYSSPRKHLFFLASFIYSWPVPIFIYHKCILFLSNIHCFDISTSSAQVYLSLSFSNPFACYPSLSFFLSLSLFLFHAATHSLFVYPPTLSPRSSLSLTLSHSFSLSLSLSYSYPIEYKWKREAQDFSSYTSPASFESLCLLCMYCCFCRSY